ncbi:helix-turn-helix domain-containing protein [Cohnella sp. GCM10027633]|uniref:helix-turn-helix domain-containing protein n=1 Tax=unclassified Cohnella TaxID=2636738 RepID=UPI0036393571
MLRFMELLQWNTIRPYIRFAHRLVQRMDLVPRLIFDHEFVWIEKGEGTMTVGPVTVRFEQGDLLLIPPGTVHKLSGPIDAHAAIHFDWEHLPSERSALDYLIDEHGREPAPAHKRGSLWLPHAVAFRSVGAEVVDSISRIVSLYPREAEKYRQLQLQIALSEMLLRLAQDIEAGRTAYVEVPHGATSMRGDPQADHAEVTALADRLMKHVEQGDVRFGELPGAMGTMSLGEAQIRRLFKRQYGSTPHAYFTLLCMNKARKLLAECNLPVQEVAFSCGYEDAKYFSRQFRRAEGVSPAAFRAMYVNLGPLGG